MEDEQIVELYLNRDESAVHHTAEKYDSYYGSEEIGTWAVFTITSDTDTGSPVRMWDKQFPLIGIDPASLNFFEP